MKTRTVTAVLTRRGGHLSPVVYRVGNRTISLFAAPPWSAEKRDRNCAPVLQVLRGDFFCMPFGDPGKPYRGEQHPPHGESANAIWRRVSQSNNHLHARGVPVFLHEGDHELLRTGKEPWKREASQRMM